MPRPVHTYFPLLESLKNYNRKIFKSDFHAGLIVGIMLIPQGMAYAFLAGMPPVYGLYGGLVPLILYAIFGTSRQLSIGPVAISSLLVLTGISQFVEPFSAEYINLVILTGFGVGLAQFALGVMRSGRVVNFISHPVITGFTAAAAVVIAINQLKDVTGINIPRFDYSYEILIYTIQHLREVHWISLVMSLGGIIIMVSLKMWRKWIPGALIVTILSILFTWLFGLDQYGLSIIGDVPRGLPSLHFPKVTYEISRLLIPVIFTVTVIGIVESVSIAKILESKHTSYQLNINQELMALGISKIGGSFFQALPTSASFTRSAINDSAGAKTTISSISAAVVVLLTLVFLTPAFYYLPNAILAAIILLAVRNLVDFKEIIYLWRTHRIDFSLMLITFLVTLLAGIEEGVFSGILLSILNVLYRSSKPNIVILGNIPGTTYYRNINRFDDAQEVDDKLIVRFEDQLYFGNATYFKDTMLSLVKRHRRDIKELLLDAKSIHYIDSSGIKALQDLNKYLTKKNIGLTICGAVGALRDQLSKSGFLAEIGDDKHFMYLHHAIEQPLPPEEDLFDHESE